MDMLKTVCVLSQVERDICNTSSQENIMLKVLIINGITQSNISKQVLFNNLLQLVMCGIAHLQWIGQYNKFLWLIFVIPMIVTTCNSKPVENIGQIVNTH